MKILIIKAHPASYGFTHAIAETYKETEEKMGNVVDVIDLYDPLFKQSFLKFENIKTDCGSTPTKILIQEKILWADELVFVCPIWQMGIPAILKNFFDNNFASGFAFKYSAAGLEQLLTKRRVRFFMTADGPAWLYWIYNPILKHITLGGFMHNYCGIKVQSITTFTKMFSKRNDTDREKMLQVVRAKAMEK